LYVLRAVVCTRLSVSDRRDFTGSVSRRSAASCGAGVIEHRRATTTATEQGNELLAKHAAADRVQEKVDGEACHVQRLGVVAEHVEKSEADVDNARPLHLEDDEVDEDRQVEQDVGRRDEDQDDGQLEIPLIETDASRAARGNRWATVDAAVGVDGGR